MTIYGSDVSHFDAPDTRRMFAEGIVFQTHKAGGDSAGGDPELAEWWQFVKSSRPAVLLGTYWVPRPDEYPSPAAEALRWLSVLDARCPGWRDGPFILQMDAERWPAGDQTKPNRAYLQALGDRLVSLAPKLHPICYASRGQYGESLAGLSFPLWNARYPTSATGYASTIYASVGGDNGAGWQSYSGQVPAVWQFTSSATIGGQFTCDANAFRGTLAQLTALVAPGWVPKEIPAVAFDDAELNQIFKTVVQNDKLVAPGRPNDGTPDNSWTLQSYVTNTYNEAKRGRIAAEAALAGLSADTVDEAAIVAGILAQLTPEAIVGAIPEGIAEQVVSLLSARLAE